MKNITINETGKLINGFNKACDAVTATAGAEGRLAVIVNELGVPTVTKDGVSVARSLFSADKEENIGMFFAKQAALKTLVSSGDSTTTTLIFAKALASNNYLKKFPWSKKVKSFNSKVKEGIDLGLVEVNKHLKTVAKKAKEKDIYNIAKVSANNNEEIAAIVEEAFKAVGAQGVIDVQQNEDSVHTTVKVSNGMRFNKGWKSPFLTTDEKTGVWEGKDVNVVLFEGTVSPSTAQIIADSLTPVQNEPVILVCERIELDTENVIVDLHRHGKLNICVIEAPYFSDERSTFFKDLALYSGGESYIQGVTKDFKFGKVDKVIIEKDSTSIIQNSVNDSVANLSSELKELLIKTPKNEYLKKRISNLEGKAAIIYVGGVTDMEINELFDRVEDSVSAVKSAVQEGIISGGGSALVYIASLMNSKFSDKNVQQGYNSIVKALYAPYEQILKNAKIKPQQYIYKIQKEYGIGYNVKTNNLENLLEEGILDSAKSIRVALENAKSVVSMLLDTEVIVTNG